MPSLRFLRFLGWCTAMLLLGGCASTMAPHNGPIATHAAARSGYRDNLSARPAGPESVSFGLSFSGGGTRAAALAYGVLEELARTPIRVGGESRRMLDLVENISAVSGGSYTAAYYGLFGDRLFQDFEQKFLKRDVQDDITSTFLTPSNLISMSSPYYGRSDVLAEYLDTVLFEGKTFIVTGSAPSRLAISEYMFAHPEINLSDTTPEDLGYSIREGVVDYTRQYTTTANPMYPNGISTSLPFDVQIDLVRSMVGLENSHILRPGYAIEYDYFDPRGLKATFETKAIVNLYFAGQINGTTGYEEAAAQGLLAGANAARRAQNKDEWRPTRHESYLGVLVDDLITKGVSEPYRMFTSRAEYRLSLREDNADARLTPIGRELGLVGDEQWAYFERKREAIEREKQRLKSTWVHPNNFSAEAAQQLLGKAIEREYNLADLLRRPNVTYDALMNVDDARFQPEQALHDDAIENKLIREQVEIDIKYAGYIERQKEEISKHANHETTHIPKGLNYQEVKGLSNEVKHKLSDHSPETIGQAARISGVTPAAISLLLVHIKRLNQSQALKPNTEQGDE